MSTPPSNPVNSDNEPAVGARIAADIDTPDKIVYGLTARQLAIVAVAAAVAYLLYRTAGWRLPAPVLVAVMLPIAGATIMLAVGRRDGLPLDAWLAAAIGFVSSPKRFAAGSTAAHLSWLPGASRVPVVPTLALPAEVIADTGVIDTGDRKVVLVAATTVNLTLRTNAEQAGLIGGFARWLHGLTGPVQVVVSTQRVELASHAARTALAADATPNRGLAAIAHDHAEFLDQLAADRDPLCRTVTVAVTAAAQAVHADRDVLHRAGHTVAALQALGVRATVLDGPRATAALTCAADPYGPADPSWPRTPPNAVIRSSQPSTPGGST